MEKNNEQLRQEMEREIAANEAADRAHRRRYIISIIIGAVIVIGGIVYVKLLPEKEPDVYYNGEHIDYARQADKMRRSGRFKDVQEYRAGYAIVSDGKHYGIIDVKGTLICPMQYDEVVANYDELFPGMAKVTKGGKRGLVDKNGKEVVPCEYDDIETPSGAVMKATKGKEIHYLDTDGKEVQL